MKFRNDAELVAFAGDDAARWASAFCDAARHLGLRVDEGWATGWFANAIETASDVRRQRHRVDPGK